MPPVPSGLVGWYTGATWSTQFTRWTDNSWNGNHATPTGTVQSVTETTTSNGNYANRQAVLYGGTGVKITFPAAILPGNYTLFHLSRYTGTANLGRIVNSAIAGQNWLSGHYYTTALGRKTGVARRPDPTGFITNSSVDPHGVGWVLSTDLRTRYACKRYASNSHAPLVAEAELGMLPCCPYMYASSGIPGTGPKASSALCPTSRQAR